MSRQSHAADRDLDAMSRGESDAPEPRIAYTLDRDARDHAEDRKNHEGEKVSQDYDSKEERDGGDRHGGGGAIGRRREQRGGTGSLGTGYVFRPCQLRYRSSGLVASIRSLFR